MKYLHLSLPTPAENLACDEALLEDCEERGMDEVLRTWESPDYFVVLGYGNQARREADITACQKRGVPVLRRCSGGGAVVQGPGSLSYALCLRIPESGPLSTITGANRWVMQRHQQLFERLLGKRVEVQGHTDLALDDRKFSGNSQRRKRRFLLFHGTFLLQLDLSLVETLLPPPSKQPDYRAHRSHTDFLVNLPLPAKVVTEALRNLWQAAEPAAPPNSTTLHRLLSEKYLRDAWNFRH